MLVKKLLSTIILSATVLASQSEAATYYVSKSGKDANNGSSSKPWLTISAAMKSPLKPGDTVIVGDGTYKEEVKFNKSGSAAGGYITLMSQNHGGAKIDATGKEYGIFSNKVSYIKIDGFEVFGSKANGILVMSSHHAEATNNIVHHNAKAGIYFGKSEFLLLEGNEAYQNAAIGPASGIAVKYSVNVSGDKTTQGPRIIVRNNISYNNVTKTGPTTDGCGFIFDDFRYVLHKGVPYLYPSLMENNIAFGNSGRGIQVVYTDYATIRNNTVYQNNIKLPGREPGPWHGELSNMSGSNNTWVNNIGVAGIGVGIAFVSTKGYTAKNVTWKNNLTFNGKPGQASIGLTAGNAMPSSANGNKLGVDPKFTNAGAKNFTLSSSSPAVNVGTSAHGVAPYDFDGKRRVVNTVDLGAYEKQ